MDKFGILKNKPPPLNSLYRMGKAKTENTYTTFSIGDHAAYIQQLGKSSLPPFGCAADARMRAFTFFVSRAAWLNKTYDRGRHQGPQQKPTLSLAAKRPSGRPGPQQKPKQRLAAKWL